MKRQRQAQDPAEDRILATPERLQHDVVTYGERDVFSELGTRGASKTIGHRVLTQRSLDMLRHRQVIDGRQFEAGDRLWRIYYVAGMSAPVTAALNGSGGGRAEPAYMLPASARAAEARLEVRDALGHVQRAWRPILAWVVLDDRTLSQFVARSGLPVTTRRRTQVATKLRAALDELADHWGM